MSGPRCPLVDGECGCALCVGMDENDLIKFGLVYKKRPIEKRTLQFMS